MVRRGERLEGEEEGTWRNGKGKRERGNCNENGMLVMDRRGWKEGGWEREGRERLKKEER